MHTAVLRGFLCVLKQQLRAINPSKRVRELTFYQGYSDKVYMSGKGKIVLQMVDAP